MAMTIESEFWTWIKKQKPTEPALAWCHSAQIMDLRSIIRSGQLTPENCEFFKEDLSYFFYGRPSYRSASDQTLSIAARAPVIFILHPNTIEKGYRLFPFDSGAHFRGRYKQWIHQKMKISDFAMPPDQLAPGKHISAFFGSNSAYLKVKPKKPEQPYIGELEVDCVAVLLTDPDISTADDRRTAIEMQSNHPIPLDSKHVWALIIPDELVDAAYVKDFIAGPGASIEILTYAMSPQKKATDYQALLEERAIELQRRRGLV